MPSLWVWGVDYQNQPLLDAWWTPGWTAQNDAYLQVPQNNFLTGGFPPNLNYVTVSGNFFDTTSDPISGYFTFWPSAALTYTNGTQVTQIPQRYAGVNQTLLGINQMGDGKIYLQFGKLSVNLLATDNANMTPTTFTYHVREHFHEGRQYDITVPSADVSTGADISTLIIPGTIRSVTDDAAFDDDENTTNIIGNDDDNDGNDDDDTISISALSTQYAVVNMSEIFPQVNIAQTNTVSFAFMTGTTLPSTGNWISASWVNNSAPWMAQVLVGPNGHILTTNTYRIWVQLSVSPQTLVAPVGYLTIY